MSPRNWFLLFVFGASAATAALSRVWPASLYAFAVIAPITALGFRDMLQRKKAILRNFPVIGHGRYLLEAFRPEINQYFVESNTNGRPFNREERSLVYQRSKGDVDTLPFGTQRDVYQVGYEWINHSMAPLPVPETPPRVEVGAATCARPYRAALLNVSAMSYGALSANAIRALNLGAKAGVFAHNTGEGGISPHHLHGGHLIWQIGTGYFGCRDGAGRFDATSFEERSQQDAVRMIEIKISQGAKPGHGGILPAAKISPEVAAIRGVGMGSDVVSPPAHTAFSTPIELLEWISRLRELSGGKPVGFKLCVGKRREFLAIVKAMLETRLHPDFITVDGGEGGTGAAPMEFSNALGQPLVEGLVFVHNALVASGFRDRVRVIAAGKVTSGFGVTKLCALGADMVNSARAMMMALGCIQARRCNNNDCPVGIATQDPALTVGLDVEHKAERVARYQRDTLHAALELVGAAGLAGPEALRPWHIWRRISPNEVRHYAELYDYLDAGCLLRDEIPEAFAGPWRRAVADTFAGAVKAT